MEPQPNLTAPDFTLPGGLSRARSILLMAGIITELVDLIPMAFGIYSAFFTVDSMAEGWGGIGTGSELFLVPLVAIPGSILAFILFSACG